MKKILCILVLILAVACVLSACNQSSSPSVETTSTTPEETTPAVTTPEEITPEVPDEPFTPSVGLAYEVNADGETCTITGIGTCTDTDIYIGGSIDGYKVTSIGNSAFYRCTSLTSVTIGDSVKRIGNYAFAGCESLTSVTIPDSVTSIAFGPFYECTSLTSILVDNDNTAYQSIDGNLYSKGGKTLITYAIGKTDKSFTIPDSVTSIGNSAFRNCTSLTSVTIGDSVTSIGFDAFYYCTSLTSITIPDSVTSIGNYAFYECTSLRSVTIPDSVTSIGYEAFYNCTSLTSATFANPNGWECEYYYDTTRVTAISASNLSNSTTAAQYLKSYHDYYWHRTE